jgi:hypothetical protein
MTARRLLFLVLAAGLVGVALISGGATQDAPPDSSSPGDVATYVAIVRDMRHGTPYYDAAREHLLANGYGLGSVFNWRTPLHPWLLAVAGETAARAALALLAVVTIVLVTLVVARTRGVRVAAFVGVVVALSALSAFVPSGPYLAEVPAGLLIMLSVSLTGLGTPVLAALAGTLALFLRELVLPYAVLGLAVALWQRQRRAAAAWAVGILAWCGYFALHARTVAEHQRPGDPAYQEGWFQFGGPGFVLRTAHFDGAFLALPLVTTALLLALALVGHTAASSPAEVLAALTVGAYLCAFLVVGKDVNTYWGALYTPLLAFGLAAAPAALRRTTPPPRAA